MTNQPDGYRPPQPSHPPAQPYRPGRVLPRAALPAVLLLACLAGIAAIMAGLLAFLTPATTTLEAEAPQELNVVNVGGTGSYLPPTVGPGGPGVPLTQAAPTAPPPSPAASPVPPVTTGRTVRPVRIAIPDLGVSAPLMRLGVKRSGEIQVPPLSRRNLAGWYRHGPVPGELGPAVILGHVNNRQGAAVFARLREIRRGQKIYVTRSDGVVAEFTVDGVEQVSKKTFPTERVYGNTTEAALRLITCGGVYDRKRHGYSDNIIVYATLSHTRAA
jgi:LPXTG-site transpeptidase (sortase) family protein